MNHFARCAKKFVASLLSTLIAASLFNLPAYAAAVRVMPVELPAQARLAPLMSATALPGALSGPLSGKPLLPAAAVSPTNAKTAPTLTPEVQKAVQAAEAPTPVVAPRDGVVASPLHEESVTELTAVQAKIEPLLQDPFEKAAAPAVPSSGGADLAPGTLGVSLRTKRILTGVVVTMPFVGFVGAMTYFWGHGFDTVQMAIMLVGMALTELGITVGFHRYFTHASFKAHPGVKVALAIFGMMAIQGSVFDWVALHRLHHASSDKPGDPHSPHLYGSGFWNKTKGFYHSHVGWFFKKDPQDFHKRIADLTSDPLLTRLDKLFPLWMVAGLIIPTVLGGLLTMSWTGAGLGLFWGGGARLFLLHHITWSINSVTHLWGPQHYRSGDQSRNNWLFGWLAFGEGWHNNHHAFPRSARHGLFWWQFDLSYLVILGLQKLGLVSNVYVPSAQTRAAKRLP